MTTTGDTEREYPSDIAAFLDKVGDELVAIPAEDRGKIHDELEKSLKLALFGYRQDQARKARQKQGKKRKWFW